VVGVAARGKGDYPAVFFWDLLVTVRAVGGQDDADAVSANSGGGTGGAELEMWISWRMKGKQPPRWRSIESLNRSVV
jgi:hypothetical protein